MSCFIELNSLYLKNPVYDKEHKVNKRKSVSDLGKLKLLNNDLITSASTGIFIRIGAADIDLKSDMIIFRSVTYFKTSNTFLLRKQNIKLSYTRTRDIVLSALSDIGLHSSEYGLHSLAISKQINVSLHCQEHNHLLLYQFSSDLVI
jgi:hypothetical protein